jgi:hypothetical protein
MATILSRWSPWISMTCSLIAPPRAQPVLQQLAQFFQFRRRRGDASHQRDCLAAAPFAFQPDAYLLLARRR